MDIDINDGIEIDKIRAEPIIVHRPERDVEESVKREGWTITIQSPFLDGQELSGEVVSVKRHAEDDVRIQLDPTSEFVNVPKAEDVEDREEER